jgi:hypothetical protein
MPTGNSENDVDGPIPEVAAPVLGAQETKPEPSQPDLAYRLAKALLEGEPSGSESSPSAGPLPGVPPVGSSAGTERDCLADLVLAAAQALPLLNRHQRGAEAARTRLRDAMDRANVALNRMSLNGREK